MEPRNPASAPRRLLRAAVFLAGAVALGLAVCLATAVEPTRSWLAALTGATDYTADAALEMQAHIQNVQADDGRTRLIIGDSVCNQVFDPFSLCNDDYRIDGSNRGVTLAGQYLLAEQFLANHPDAADVYLVLAPDSFAAGFDANWGYQYVVTPFASGGLLHHLDAATYAELQAAYGAPFITGRFVNWLNRSPVGKKVYLNALADLSAEQDAGPLNPMAERCLRNLAGLCAEKGVAFHLVCDPLADSESRRTSLAALEEAFRAAGLYETYQSYFTDVLWQDPALFQPDGLHFNYETADMDFFAALIREMQEKSGLFGGIVLSYE